MEKLILKYLNNESTEKEKAALLEWIRISSENKQIFEEIYNIWLSSSSLFMSEEDTNKAILRFKTNVLSYEKSKTKTKTRFFLFNKWAAVASILIAIFSIGGFILGSRTSDTPIQMYTAIMGKGSKGFVTLPDSSIVWLNSDSRLVYPEKFSENERIVKLEGEGYFDVVKNSDAPFFVETGGMTINVLGTQFDVKNYNDAEIIETTLISGSVEVYLTKLDKRTILKPNQKLLYNSTLNNVDVNQLDAQEQILWINDQLEFSNERLSDIFRKLEHWYGINIDYANGINQNQRLSFVVKNETKEEIFKLLSLIAPIKYTIEGNKIITIHDLK